MLYLKISTLNYSDISKRFRNVFTGCQWNLVSCCDHMVWKLLVLYRLISAALLAICLSDFRKPSPQSRASLRSRNAETSRDFHLRGGQMSNKMGDLQWQGANISRTREMKKHGSGERIGISHDVIGSILAFLRNRPFQPLPKLVSTNYIHVTVHPRFRM